MIGLRALIAVVAVLAALAVQIPDRPKKPEVAGRGAVSIEVPRRVSAGEPLEILLLAPEAAAAASWEVRLTGAYGTIGVPVEVVDGVGSASAPPSVVESAGSLALAVTGSGARADVEILPGEARRPLVPLLGARSIVADGRDAAMVAGVPLDRFGNVVEEGTSVRVLRTGPEGELGERTLRVRDLIARGFLRAGTIAGVSRVGLVAGRATGPLVELREVPGRPESIALITPAQVPPADGRSLLELETERLEDRFGNTIADGTVVVFELDSSLGSTSAEAVSVGGVARTVLPVPAEPVTLRARARVAGLAGSRVSVALDGALVREPPISAVAIGRNLRVTVGPAVDRRGGFLPDGTAVRLRVGGRAHEAELDAGMAHFRTPDRGSREVLIQLAGRTLAAEVSR